MECAGRAGGQYDSPLNVSLPSAAVWLKQVAGGTAENVPCQDQVGSQLLGYGHTCAAGHEAGAHQHDIIVTRPLNVRLPSATVWLKEVAGSAAVDVPRQDQVSSQLFKNGYTCVAGHEAGAQQQRNRTGQLL